MADISKITLNGTDYNVKDANAQETLVSGTNIKTINNESILGSGNITIQGGGGGGETVVELTQDQYDALSAYAPDTTYIITDAQAINMDDYATTAQTSAIAQDVSAVSASVETKADKVSVTARGSNYYFPRWNSQGIITGDTQVYNRSLSINGTNKGMIQTTNSDFTGIYAPTSAGTQNAPLLSNGSGAPVWASYKFQFITQAAYDQLSTKDSTTIYFIVGD